MKVDIFASITLIKWSISRLFIKVIIALYILSRTGPVDKRELCKSIYNVKVLTFTLVYTLH